MQLGYSRNEITRLQWYTHFHGTIYLFYSFASWLNLHGSGYDLFGCLTLVMIEIAV